MGKRIGKYKIDKREEYLDTYDTENNSPATLAVAGVATVGGTLGVTGIATLTAKSVHTAGLSATTGNLEVVAGTLDVQDGGTITQGSNKQTGVTLSTHSGQITMHAEALAAAAETTFIVTNTKVSATDVVVACHGSAGTTAAYTVEAHTMGSGVFSVTVSNVTAGSLGEAIVINFVVLKGASS